jgi:lipid II:glycine glycyltransferase (peptidoglycan interpeptide bridge formation enzyme)
MTEQNKRALHPMQTWEWGEARKKMGLRVEKIIDGDSIFQFTIHPIPHTSFSIGYLPRSPMPTETVLRQLYEFGKKNNLLLVKMEPYISYEEGRKLKISNFQIAESPHPLFPEWTQTLDMTASEEDLLKKMKPKTRYNIRLAEKKGVTVRQMDSDEGFAIFSRLYFETCARQHYHGHTPQYHKQIWDEMKKNQGHILISFYEGKALGAYELYYLKENLYYVYGGSSIEHKQVMAPNILMWEAIRFGKKMGAKTFDMWGSLPPQYAQNHSWAGFTRFKEGYGTTFTHLSSSYDLIINPLLYRVYNLAYSVREKIL